MPGPLEHLRVIDLTNGSVGGIATMILADFGAEVIKVERPGGDPFRFHGNVPNTGHITNLPQDACVEVPVYADRHRLNAIHVGPLPPQCAALNNVVIAGEEMAVEACLTGDPELVYWACCYDPLTAAVCSLDEIRKMVNAMLRKNAKYLPHFKRLKV